MNKYKILKNTKEKTLNLVIALLISTLFLLLFSSTTSPLTKNFYGQDSSFFIIFGKGILNGLIPYKDMFDHKGPVFFFLQSLGQLIGEGKTGAFIIQILSLAITLFFVDKIFNLKQKQKPIKRFLLILPILYICAATFEGGNLTEEYSLPLLVISLYLYLKFILCNKSKHNPLVAMAYGIFFCMIALSKITNAAYLCAVVLSIIIILIQNKEYKNILNNALLFIVGILIVFIPVAVYYAANNALNEMLYSTFIYAFSYATDVTLVKRLQEYFSIINITYIITIIAPIIVIWKNKKTEKKEFLIAWIGVIATLIATFLGSGYLHYFVLSIPNLVLALYELLNMNFDIKKLYKNRIIAACILIIFLVQSIYVGREFAITAIETIDYNVTYQMLGYNKRETELAVNIIENIPKEERKNVWGYGIESAFYLRTDILPAIRYFSYLDEHTSYLDTKNKLISDLNSKKPRWVVLNKEVDSIPDYLEDFININNYKQYAENEKYILYKI